LQLSHLLLQSATFFSVPRPALYTHLHVCCRRRRQRCPASSTSYRWCQRSA
jgi:hypothetical protein